MKKKWKMDLCKIECVLEGDLDSYQQEGVITQTAKGSSMHLYGVDREAK